MQLGEYLISKKLLTKEQLSAALKEQMVTGERLGKILVRWGIISGEVLFRCLSELNPDSLAGDSRIQVDLPDSLFLHTQSMPLGDTGTEIYIASIHSDPVFVKKEFERHLNGKRTVKFAIANYQKTMQYLMNLKNKGDMTTISSDPNDVNQLIDNILTVAVKKNATDIHIESAEKSIHIRYRIDGVLNLNSILSLSIKDVLFSRLKDIAGMDVSEKRVPQDGSFFRDFGEKTVDFRVSVMPSAYGEKATIRVLDKERLFLDIRKLGITQIDDWIRISKLPNGLILVCGATGSGKTTTLYATVKSLDTLGKSVYMIEDPIEYRVPFITQVQVNRKAGLDYASFLKGILRHDPDICVIGEIRDAETAENALRLADTGHLVFATLHTNDVQSSIVRLVGLGVSQLYLRYLLRGVLVQKLIRKLCVACNGAGCNICDNEGYKGMTLVTELATIDAPDDIEKILNGQKKYHTFYDDIKIKIKNGEINMTEVYRVFNLDGEICIR